MFDESVPRDGAGDACDDAPLADPARAIRALFENTTDIIFMVDDRRRIVMMNSVFAREFRLAYGQVLAPGDNALTGLPPEVAAMWVELYDRALAGESMVVPFQQLSQGEVRHFDVKLDPVRVGDRIVGASVIARDITARKHMEDAIRASQARLAAILDNTQDSIWSVDTRYRLVAFNEAFFKDVQIAYGGELREGMVVMDAFPAEMRAPWTTFYDRAFAGERFTFDFTTETPPRTFEISLNPIAADGRVIGACIQSRETTARRRAEEALRNTERKLYFADRMVTVGTLAAGVAHEINNPLAYVYSHLELLAQEVRRMDALSPDQRARLVETIGVVQDGAERIRVIVHDLGTFSRVDEDAEPTVINLRDVIDVALKMAAVEIRHRAQIGKEYGDVPPVLANPARLGQVFLNLLVNAAQATPEGDPERHRITVRTQTDAAGRAIVEVIDTGCGISEDLQKRIFDPFFTTKPIGMGTGLGLSICHGIVSGLGGELTVRSSVGEGSTFRVALPFATAFVKRISTQSMPAVTAPASPTARLLVIDDEQHLLSSWRHVFQSFETVTCRSAREALSVLAVEPAFDAIVCDMMMPDRTGMDLFEDIRQRWPGMQDRMIFVTGSVFTTRAREFLATSGAPLLKKPFASSVLVAAVRGLIERQRAPQLGQIAK